jgi:hypothetical protein
MASASEVGIKPQWHPSERFLRNPRGPFFPGSSENHRFLPSSRKFPPIGDVRNGQPAKRSRKQKMELTADEK